MFKLLASVLSVMLVAGCSGITIKGLGNVPEDRGDLEGYVVYEPIVMVAVAQAQHGGCALTQFTVPDYRKPYLVGARSGLGKSGVNVTLTDGWRLGGFTDNSDNSSLFPVSDLLKAFAGLVESAKECGWTGLFVVQMGENGLPVFTPVHQSLIPADRSR